MRVAQYGRRYHVPYRTGDKTITPPRTSPRRGVYGKVSMSNHLRSVCLPCCGENRHEKSSQESVYCDLINVYSCCLITCVIRYTVPSNEQVSVSLFSSQVRPSTSWGARRFRTTQTEETAYFRTTKFGRWSRQWRCSSYSDRGGERATTIPSCLSRIILAVFYFWM